MKTLSFFVIKLMICIIGGGVTLYLLTEKQNALIETQILIPNLTKEVRQLKENNKRLRFEIERFENPVHLMEYARRPEYGHLKYPINEETITIHAEAHH